MRRRTVSRALTGRPIRAISVTRSLARVARFGVLLLGVGQMLTQHAPQAYGLGRCQRNSDPVS